MSKSFAIVKGLQIVLVSSNVCQQRTHCITLKRMNDMDKALVATIKRKGIDRHIRRVWGILLAVHNINKREFEGIKGDMIDSVQTAFVPFIVHFMTT